MVVSFDKSVCNGCKFRQKNGTCTLLGVHFTEKTGAFKCYTLVEYTPEELVMDIIKYLKGTGPVKVKEIGKHFGFSPQKAIRIMEKLEKAGLVKREKWGRTPFFSLRDTSEEVIEEAVQLVSNIYPTSPKGKIQRKNRKELLMALGSVSNPALLKA